MDKTDGQRRKAGPEQDAFSRGISSLCGAFLPARDQAGKLKTLLIFSR
jgi:hypothetical protein